MKWSILATIIAFSFFLIGYFGMKEIDYKFLNGKILSISDEHLLDTATPTSILTLSPSPTTTPSPIPTPTTIPTPTITPTPVPTHIPQPQVSPEDIHGFMERFAGQYGIDVNVLRHIAVCESGFNPLAINALYAGLFQFNTSTWKNNRLLMGEDPNPDLRLNAEEATQTAAYLMSLGKFYLWPNCHP